MILFDVAMGVCGLVCILLLFKDYFNYEVNDMSVKTYSLSRQGKTKLSAHFSVSEFGSVSGSKVYSDTVLIDTALIDLIEKVYSNFNCSKIIISSGYRTSAHDKAVGGSGSGYHCKGQAADFCCYDSTGNQIDSKKVVCYLEDIKCYGIGYKCGGSQYYTHADTRAASAKWWGDESKNYRSIQSINGSTSFYTYLGISKTNSASTTAASTAVKISADKTMTLSTNGLNLIKSFEGLSLKACKAVSTEKYYTIGYGHYGADVKANQTITEAEALALLKKDCTTFVSAVNEAVTVGVTQNQFDAMVSLAYNIGVSAFKNSDLVKFLNAGKPWAATAEFPLWRKSGGAILAGLQNRRQKEMSLFGVGCDYTLSDNMNVRSGAGTSYSVKKVSQLTADGKKHATSTNANDNAVFKKGTVVTAQELKAVYSTSKIDIWCRCPSGWICLKNGDDIYAV